MRTRKDYSRSRNQAYGLGDPVGDRLRAEIAFYGTPGKNYADSGLWKFLPYVLTVDEHDRARPMKPFVGPGGLKDYQQAVFWWCLAYDLVGIPKSRQVMVSWMMAIFCAWFARTRSHAKIIWQSKREEDASDMVSRGDKAPFAGRISFIEMTLRDPRTKAEAKWLRDPLIYSGVGNKVGRLNYYNESQVIAIPEGESIIRSQVPSLMVADEAAFQEGFSAAYGAALPAVRGGGKLIMVSSAAPSFFDELVHRTPKQAEVA